MRAAVENPLARASRKVDKGVAPPPFEFSLTHPDYLSPVDWYARTWVVGCFCLCDTVPRALLTHRLMTFWSALCVCVRVWCVLGAGSHRDVMKLTAQFAAAGGANFLFGLSTREFRNPQFEFLKQTNPLFAYFMSLVKQYTDAIKPSQELRQRLQTIAQDRNVILERAVHRMEYERTQEEQKRLKVRASSPGRLMRTVPQTHTPFVVIAALLVDKH